MPFDDQDIFGPNEACDPPESPDAAWWREVWEDGTSALQSGLFPPDPVLSAPDDPPTGPDSMSPPDPAAMAFEQEVRQFMDHERARREARRRLDVEAYDSTTRSLTEDELRAVEPPKYELDGRTQQGGVTFIVGPRGVHKSRMLAAASGALLTEGEWYGAKALRRGAVLAVIAEDLPGWRQRYFAWRDASQIPSDRKLPLHTWTAPLNLFTGLGFDALLAEIQRINPVLIVFDTFSDVISGADENSQQHITIVRERLKALRAGGRSAYLTHHTGYNEDRERGSSVIGALADTMIMLKENNGIVEMENTKQRNGPAFAPVSLAFDPKTLVLSECIGVLSALPKNQETVLDALMKLAATAPEGVAAADWKTRCIDVEGVKDRTFYDAKKKLEAAGRVRELQDRPGYFLPQGLS